MKVGDLVSLGRLTGWVPDLAKHRYCLWTITSISKSWVKAGLTCPGHSLYIGTFGGIAPEDIEIIHAA